jgi:LPXTG-motif cell wall-anchored protein
MKTIGIAIVIIGLGMTLFTAITYFTREKVADLGVLEITRNQPHNLSWSPFIGMAVMVVGAFLILRGRKK